MHPPTGLTKKILQPLNYGRRAQTGGHNVSVHSNDNLYKWYSYLVYWQIRTCFTYLLRLQVEPVHVSLVAVDVEKLTTTSRRLPHKSRQETQSTAAFFKPSTASSGATAASGKATGGLEV
jgi:hypothetical protein